MYMYIYIYIDRCACIQPRPYPLRHGSAAVAEVATLSYLNLLLVSLCLADEQTYLAAPVRVSSGSGYIIVV